MSYTREVLSGSKILALGLTLTALTVSYYFGYPFTTGKFLCVALSVTAACFVVFEKKLIFHMPRSKEILFSFLGTFLFVIVSLCFSPGGEHANGILLIIAWVLLAFTTAAFVYKEGSEPFLKNFFLWQVPIIVLIFSKLLHHELFVKTLARPFFGNPNITGNFVVISIISLLFFINFKPSPLLKKLALLYLVIGGYVIFSLGARGALLGLLAGLVVFSFIKWDFKKIYSGLKTQQKGLFWVSMLIMASLASYALFKKGATSLEYRYQFWRNTLCLIKDYPLGVGPGSFEYVFQLYNGRCYPSVENAEGYLVRNPHNIFLEFIAEIGFAGALCLFTLLFFIFKNAWSLRKSKPHEALWVLSMGALFVVQGFFEFPQDTPYTYFILSILIGFAFALLPSKANLQSSYLRVVSFAASLLVLLIFSMKGYSDYLTKFPGNTQEEKLARYQGACAIDKENWRACAHASLILLELGEIEKTEKIISEIEQRLGSHHSILHLRGSVAEKKGDFATACSEFKKYHALFGGNTSKKEYLEKNCSN